MHEIALKVLKKITDASFKAYIVGGYPRDRYLDRLTIDVDICTNATPMDLKKLFEGSILAKQVYGGVTVIINNIQFEITTFRKELKYQSHRFPVEIKYIEELVDDLERRDFTINTLCIDEHGNEIDLLNAKIDIDNKIIRTVGNSDDKIETDILRALRAIRFATVLNFKLDDDLKKSIKKYRHLLKNLSYYRKREELEKIFISPNAKYGVDLIVELGLTEVLELKNIENLVITTNPITMWTQLDVITIYNFSKTEKQTMEKVNELMNLDILDPHNLYNYGLYYSTLVGEIKKINRKEIVYQYSLLPIKSQKELAIKGNEIANLLNIETGFYLKEILNNLETKIIDNDLKNNKEALKAYILKEFKHD